MARKSKLRTYRTMKDMLVLEEYVVQLNREGSYVKRGTNKLRIETGRWVGESEKERVC